MYFQQFNTHNTMTSRSRCSQVLFKISVHKKFAKFTEKRLSQSLLFDNVTGCQLETLMNTSYTEHLSRSTSQFTLVLLKRDWQ